jgi:hypothetical protein
MGDDDFGADIDRKSLVSAYKEAIRHCKKYNQTSDLWLIKRLFAGQFLRAAMKPGAAAAYKELRSQLNNFDRKTWQEQHIVVPKNIAPGDARKALQLIRLECDPTWNFHVTWEAQPGKKNLLKGCRPQHFKG